MCARLYYGCLVPTFRLPPVPEGAKGPEGAAPSVFFVSLSAASRREITRSTWRSFRSRDAACCFITFQASAGIDTKPAGSSTGAASAAGSGSAEPPAPFSISPWPVCSQAVFNSGNVSEIYSKALYPIPRRMLEIYPFDSPHRASNL